jgi:hypothetical protein
MAASFEALMGLNLPTVGASGAVFAIFMVFALHFPRRKLYLFGVLGIEVRWLLVAYAGWESLQLVRTMAIGAEGVMRAIGRGESLTSHSAHLGGLLFGYLYVRWHMRLSNWWDHFAGRMRTASKQRKSNLRVFNPGSQPDVDLSSKVDAILDKISREGEASLTDRERRILTQASEQLKNKR